MSALGILALVTTCAAQTANALGAEGQQAAQSASANSTPAIHTEDLPGRADVQPRVQPATAKGSSFSCAAPGPPCDPKPASVDDSGNDPVFVFGTRLRQLSFTTTDFALNKLSTTTSRANRRSSFQRRNYQIYSRTSGTYNFNGLVRHSLLRHGPNQADIQVDLLGRHQRRVQSHDIAKSLRPGLVEIGNRYGARIKVAEVPPGPPVVECPMTAFLRKLGVEVVG